MNKIEEIYLNGNRGHVKMMTRILNGDWAAAEDVVQEAYARALQYFPTYDPERGPIIPWFNRILFNSLRDIQREYKSRPTESSDDIGEEEVLNGVVLPDNVVEIIQDVKNEKHQRILYLFYVLGYNSREITEIEDEVTQTNVTTVVSRFRDSFVEE